MTIFARTNLAGFAVAGLVSLTALAQAAAPERLRGTIDAIEPSAITLKTPDGRTERVALADDAKVSWVIPASLDQIKEGTFIGTATKGENRGRPSVLLRSSIRTTAACSPLCC